MRNRKWFLTWVPHISVSVAWWYSRGKVQRQGEGQVIKIHKTSKLLSCAELIAICHKLLNFRPERSMLSENVSNAHSLKKQQQPNIINNHKFIVNSMLHSWEINIAQQNSEFDSFWGCKLKKKKWNKKHLTCHKSEYYISSSGESMCLRDQYDWWHTT